MEIDGLSALPDDLLVDILGRLRCTKEAAKTAALSKRWRFLWTKLPWVYLRNAENDESFARIREALASLRKASLDLEHRCSLQLSLSYDDSFADDLVSLLDFAAESMNRDVNVDITPVRHKRYSGCTLPQALYSYPSLTKLSLENLKLVPPATSVEWGLMNELSFLFVELPQQAIDQIISGCPLLIRLKVIICSGYNRLDVRGQHFRQLDVAAGGYCTNLLEISAPYMTSLIVFMNPRLTTLMLTDVSSVEQLRICFWCYSYEDKETEMFGNNEQLFQLLQRVTSLELYSGLIQVLSNMRKINGEQLPQFRVHHLTIQDRIDIDNITGVLAILESSPYLDKLAIYETSRQKHKNMDWDPSVEADLICDLLHLKSVEIHVYVAPEIPHELYILLAQMLLRRAPFLEEMIIKGKSVIESEDCIELMIKKFEALLTYPRSSHKAVVHIIN